MSTEFINDQWRLPNAFNGTESNVNKQSNYSMDFDSASSDYVDLGDDDIFSFGDSTNDSPFSISAWIYMDSTTNFRILAKYGAPNYEYQFDVGGSSNLRFFIFDGSSYRARTGSTLSINQWYHVVATYNGVGGTNAENGIKIYVDGVEITGTTDSNGSYTAMHNTTAPVYIGRIASSYANGKIDAVCIYNYPLSQSQITTLYGSSSTGIGNPMSLSPKPVAYYPLGDQDAFNGADYLVPNSSLKDYVFDFIPNDYIDCGTGLGNSLGTYTGDLTFSIWFNTDTVNPANDGIFYIGDFNSQGAIQVNIYNNNIIFRANGGAGSKQFSFTDTTSWHNLTCVYLTGDRANSKIYLDGILQTTSDSGSFPSSLSLSGLKTIIGSYYNSTFNFDGKLSNFQIFNTALPATGSNSVETLYNNGSPLTSMSGFTSLVSWWKLDASDTYDSSTGNWTIEDHAGSNDGTSSGMTQANLVQSDLSFTSGYSPFALDFDGTNDYINSGLTLGSTDFTFSCWVKHSGNFSGNFQNITYHSLVSKNQIFIGFLMYHTSGTNLVLRGLSNGSADGTTQIGTGWNHIAGVFNNTSGSLIYYLNGQPEITTTIAQNSFNTRVIEIGKLATGNYVSNYTAWNGSIDEYAIWNAELTQAQVSELYNEGVPSNLNNHSAYSNLVSWWQLGSNSSFNTNWTVLDEKGSNNGTSVNMGEDAIVDGVGSYANGLSSGMGGDEVIGDAPYSTANSLSVNMDVEDRVTDTPS